MGRYLALVGLGSLFAVACQPQLDTEAIASDIYDDLSASGLPLDSVTCPSDIPLAYGESFRCWGTLSDGVFAIYVDQEDEQGTVSWDVPSSRRVINVDTLEAYFRNAIRDEMGEMREVNCGDEDYRLNRPGDRFDCTLTEAVPLEEDEKRQLESIQVQLDSQGNVNWQQIRNLVTDEEGEDGNADADEVEA